MLQQRSAHTLSDLTLTNYLYLVIRIPVCTTYPATFLYERVPGHPPSDFVVVMEACPVRWVPDCGTTCALVGTRGIGRGGGGKSIKTRDSVNNNNNHPAQGLPATRHVISTLFCLFWLFCL